MNLFSIFIASLLVNNVILSKFLGMCPFLGVSTKLSSAVGMGVAVIFVILGASVVSWLLYYYALVPLGLEYMELICFILLIASFVQFVEMFVKKTSPALYKSLGIYLPLITTNCAVLFVAMDNITQKYNLIETAVNSVAVELQLSDYHSRCTSGRRRNTPSFNPPKCDCLQCFNILSNTIAMAGKLIIASNLMAISCSLEVE